MVNVTIYSIHGSYGYVTYVMPATEITIYIKMLSGNRVALRSMFISSPAAAAKLGCAC